MSQGPALQTGTVASTSAAPLRGTQSLVGVMGAVWRRPVLTVLEIAWRWAAAVPLAWLLWHMEAATFSRVPLDTTALESMTFLEPVRSAAVLVRQLRLYTPPLRHTLALWVPLAIAVWSALAVLGRTAILRRADAALKPKPQAMVLFCFTRTISFVVLLALWLAGSLVAVQVTVISPGQRGAEPNVVLLTAAVVTLTLAAFLVWSLLVWPLDLLPLQAMAGMEPLTGPRRRHLRAKLVETNLVMGIVRVALLVLAMTFSASPLPFQNQETQGFITLWWIGVGLLYLVASDFFHVVRRVTYLRLLQSIGTQANAGRHTVS